jgi:hypothetical protein
MFGNFFLSGQGRFAEATDDGSGIFGYLNL